MTNLAYFSITGIINFIGGLFLTIFVLSKNPYSKININFSIMNLAIAIWSFGYIFWPIATTQRSTLFWFRFLHLGATFIPITIYHFVYTLLSLHTKRVLIYGYISSIFISLFVFTPYFISGMRPVSIFPYWGIPGPMYYMYLLNFFGYGILSIFAVIRAYNTSIKKNNNKLKYIIIALTAGYLGGSTNYLLFFKIPIPPYLNILLVIYISLIAYAIVAHKLLDINILLKKTFIYSSVVTALLFIYIFGLVILEHFFRKHYNYNSVYPSLIVITFLVVLFTPLKNKIQHHLDKHFFHGTISQIDEENVKLRDEIQKSDRLRSVATLAAGMAHEIKNPLTSIKTFTEYLPEKGNDPEFRKKFQRIVGNEVEHINTIVKQLLEFSKPSELELKKTNISSLLDNTLELLSNDLLKANISIEKKYHPSLPEIYIDPSQIKQVFLNLILNAREAMPDGGSISVKTTKDSGHITIIITDSGKGISKEDLKHVFDPFFTKKDGGTGLGLSIVHGIIKKHGGTINVVSNANTGTSFRITFPIKR